MTEVPVTDVLRLTAGTVVLAFASWTDWQWRRAPNVLWVILGGAGLALLAVDLALDPSAFLARWRYLAIAPLFAGFIYVAWRLRLIAGGADAKALMALAILLPFPIELGALPLASSQMPASFAAFGNSLLAFLLVPLGFLVWNVAHGRLRVPHVLLGLPVPLGALGTGHHWPMERVEDGRVRTTWFPQRGGTDPDELRDALAAAGRERAWVTPKVPFMIPLLVGFVAAFTVGDVLGWLVARALG